MAFTNDQWNTLLPSYLTDESKMRLQRALRQFHGTHTHQISYDNFYKNFKYEYLLQGDMLMDIRNPHWNALTDDYDKTYVNALILSNTCDISFDNERIINPKQCLFAPVVNLPDFLDDLLIEGHTMQKVSDFKNNLIAQFYTNLIYLPKVKDNDVERIALLDRMFWYPTHELEPLLKNVEDERICSLSQFGFYLLILKLSYHFCRLPEQFDRVA